MCGMISKIDDGRHIASLASRQRSARIYNTYLPPVPAFSVTRSGVEKHFPPIQDLQSPPLSEYLVQAEHIFYSTAAITSASMVEQ